VTNGKKDCFVIQAAFESYVSSICESAFIHLKNISKLRHVLNDKCGTDISCFMTARLDYCNAILGVCPACLINKLQLVQITADAVLTRTKKYDHINPY